MSLKQYLDEVLNRNNSQYSTLTPIQERELAIKAKYDNNARKKFIEHNLRLVITKLNREYNRFNLTESEKLEVICEANQELGKGLDKFKIKGDENGEGYIKFSTFIYKWRLKRSMDRTIAKLRYIRIPEHIKQLRNKIYFETENYLLEHNKEPTYKQLSKIIGINAEKIKEASNIYNLTNVQSYSTPLGDEGFELSDIISTDDGRDEIDLLSFPQLKKIMVKKMDILTSYERHIIIENYFHNLTLSEISMKIRISKNKVLKIHNKALRKLKISITKDKDIMTEIANYI
jgi:RNA polymerase sigma factor (sigma-70 family)